MRGRGLRSYRVTCQDAIGHTTTVTVKASTDEKACEVALKTLNSWRPVRAVPVAEPKPKGSK